MKCRLAVLGLMPSTGTPGPAGLSGSPGLACCLAVLVGTVLGAPTPLACGGERKEGGWPRVVALPMSGSSCDVSCVE